MENSFSACVVGAGIIGKHHASSLESSGFKVTIVDPIKVNLTNCSWYSALDSKIIEDNQIFIISTTASNHFEIVKMISSSEDPKVVIIEKPLFCNEWEYEDFREIDASTEHKFYCNLPFFYNKYLINLKKKGFHNLRSYRSVGSNWGLACNSLHDLSIIHFFSASKEIEISKIQSNLTSYERSKREEYFEVYGSIKFISNSKKVSFECYKSSQIQKILYLDFEEGEAEIDIYRQEASYKKDGQMVRDRFQVNLASKTTGKVCISLLNDKKTLPPANLFLDASLAFYRELASIIKKKNHKRVDFPFS